jgi:hypothetical protein
MRTIIYILTALVLVCDLLFGALVVLALRPEQGANMVLMAAPLFVWPSILISIVVILLLRKSDPVVAMHKSIYRFHAISCISVLYTPFILEFFFF